MRRSRAASTYHFFGNSLNVGALMEPLTSQIAEYLVKTAGELARHAHTTC